MCTGRCLAEPKAQRDVEAAMMISVCIFLGCSWYKLLYLCFSALIYLLLIWAVVHGWDGRDSGGGWCCLGGPALPCQLLSPALCPSLQLPSWTASASASSRSASTLWRQEVGLGLLWGSCCQWSSSFPALFMDRMIHEPSEPHEMNPQRAQADAEEGLPHGWASRDSQTWGTVRK